MFDITKCGECGDCLVQCQYVDYSREKAVQEIRALRNGKDADILRECITCIACNEYCPTGANPFDLISALQEEKGIQFIPKEIVEFIDDTAAGVTNEIILSDEDKPAVSLCIMEHAYPQGLTESMIFKGLTLIKGNDYYSRAVYLHAGMESRVKEYAKQFIDNLTKLGKEEIIFLHQDCYTLAAKKAFEYGIKVPFKPVHIVEYMVRYLKQHEDSIIPLNRKIAYQRPCISRYTPEKEHFIDEFFRLVGVERVARKYDRQNALCCAAGFVEINPERALPIVERNVNDAKAFAADAMVFLCVGCYWFMSGLCEERGLPSMFITDLCRMAIGEIPFSSRPWGGE